MNADQQLERLVRMAGTDPDVLAVILFGSRARGDHHAGSDVDVCLVSAPVPRDAARPGRLALRYASVFDLDVHVFE